MSKKYMNLKADYDKLFNHGVRLQNEVRTLRGAARPRGVDNARVEQVICTKSLRGRGTQDDQCRLVTQYWDFEGNFLAELDPCAQ